MRIHARCLMCVVLLLPYRPARLLVTHSYGVAHTNRRFMPTLPSSAGYVFQCPSYEGLNPAVWARL